MNYFAKLRFLLNNAYAPYSKFKVSAIVVADNKEFYGVNIENASYGATICAERVAINNAIASGTRAFKELHILSSANDFCYPCALCLQVMSEFFDSKTKIIVYNKKGEHKTILFNKLLPIKFNSLPNIKYE